MTDDLLGIGRKTNIERCVQAAKALSSFTATVPEVMARGVYLEVDVAGYPTLTKYCTFVVSRRVTTIKRKRWVSWRQGASYLQEDGAAAYLDE